MGIYDRRKSWCTSGKDWNSVNSIEKWQGPNLGARHIEALAEARAPNTNSDTAKIYIPISMIKLHFNFERLGISECRVGRVAPRAPLKPRGCFTTLAARAERRALPAAVSRHIADAGNAVSFRVGWVFNAGTLAIMKSLFSEQNSDY
jgi:hypothetical protein